MTYEHFNELADLIARKMISARPHPSLPLIIYNYTAAAQHTPMAEWTEAMKDCRGLILDVSGEVVGRPFRKFWNYEQVLDQIPSEPFTVWEKLDGSLGIACQYAGELVCATRGSFESDQAKWFGEYLRRHHGAWLPTDVTYLFEIVFPENRIVVDYGKTAQPFLLAVLAPDAVDVWTVFDHCDRFKKARQFDVTDFGTINEDPRYAGQEGFVVQWQSGFRAKLKLEEYKRLHRLITQCSTRTIWEMLRTGGDVQELLDRVPSDFEQWARDQIASISSARINLNAEALGLMRERPESTRTSRKDFAAWATQQTHPSLLFSLLDGRDITESTWKIVEPRWTTPFRKDIDS